MDREKNLFMADIRKAILADSARLPDCNLAKAVLSARSHSQVGNGTKHRCQAAKVSLKGNRAQQSCNLFGAIFVLGSAGTEQCARQSHDRTVVCYQGGCRGAAEQVVGWKSRPPVPGASHPGAEAATHSVDDQWQVGAGHAGLVAQQIV